jgi:hypothetical protein
MMKLAKILAVSACAGLLLASGFGWARHAYAQADDGALEGYPDVKKTPPFNFEGCWAGDAANVFDTVDFNFGELDKSKITISTFDFNFSDGGPGTDFTGNFTGTASANGLKMTGDDKVYTSAGIFEGCKFTASGTVDKGSDPVVITGKYKFAGKCPAGMIRSGEFSINQPC